MARKRPTISNTRWNLLRVLDLLSNLFYSFMLIASWYLMIFSFAVIVILVFSAGLHSDSAYLIDIIRWFILFLSALILNFAHCKRIGG